MKKDLLSIYETPEMRMMMDLNNNRTSLKAEKVSSFDWCPNANKLFITYNMGEITKLQIRELPSRLDNVTKSYSNVKKLKHKWHPIDCFIGIQLSFIPPKKSIKIDESLLIIDHNSK